MAVELLVLRSLFNNLIVEVLLLPLIWSDVRFGLYFLRLQLLRFLAMHQHIQYALTRLRRRGWLVDAVIV